MSGDTYGSIDSEGDGDQGRARADYRDQNATLKSAQRERAGAVEQDQSQMPGRAAGPPCPHQTHRSRTDCRGDPTSRRSAVHSSERPRRAGGRGQSRYRAAPHPERLRSSESFGYIRSYGRNFGSSYAISSAALR